MSVTGGLVYHWRAYKYRDTLWSQYRQNISKWLNTWPQRSESLVLIGPSAGYSLPFEFLARYKIINVNDIDSVAKIIFKKRFSPLKINWNKNDLLGTQNNFDLNQFERYLLENPNSDILFCNILGQISILTQDNPKKFILWSSKLKKLIQGRNYASYHDLFSFEGKFNWRQSKIQCEGAIEEQDLLTQFIDVPKNLNVELADHWTQNLVSLGPREILHWQLKPNKHHLIECVQGNSI